MLRRSAAGSCQCIDIDATWHLGGIPTLSSFGTLTQLFDLRGAIRGQSPNLYLHNKEMCLKFAFNETHYAAFKSFTDRVEWVGKRADAFDGYHSEPKPPACSVPLKRSDLEALARDKNCGDETFIWRVMAWGGMSPFNAPRLHPFIEALVPIVCEMRTSTISRAEAYDRLARFRRDHPGCGMGPAYFTKLIFFARKSRDGYILDQWTARSINLLLATEEHRISLNRANKNSFVVSDRNTADDYERYCSIVEHMASEEGVRPDEIELRLFSSGVPKRGGKRGEWRAYVIQQSGLASS